MISNEDNDRASAVTESAQHQNIAQHEKIKKALALDYDASTVSNYYQDWATSYDRDVAKEQYTAPGFIARYFRNLARHAQFEPNQGEVDFLGEELNIIDAGCGTGLVGQALYELGYRGIDGFDLSHSMIEVAGGLGVYRQLTGGCDLIQGIPEFLDHQYDACLCCGVFTSGHVTPQVLPELLRITRPGGMVLISTRIGYSRDMDFPGYVESLEQQGQVKLVEVKEGPYTAEEGAYFWALKALKNP